MQSRKLKKRDLPVPRFRIPGGRCVDVCAFFNEQACGIGTAAHRGVDDGGDSIDVRRIHVRGLRNQQTHGLDVACFRCQTECCLTPRVRYIYTGAFGQHESHNVRSSVYHRGQHQRRSALLRAGAYVRTVLDQETRLTGIARAPKQCRGIEVILGVDIDAGIQQHFHHVEAAICCGLHQQGGSASVPRVQVLFL